MSEPRLTGQVALGTGAFSIEGGRDRDADIKTLRAAADAGIRIFDAARAYAPVDDPLFSERLLAEALAGRDVVIGTKGGHFRASPTQWAVDNSAERLRRDVDNSLRGLGVEIIDLYYIHRVDDLTVPVEEGVAALADLRAVGKIVRIGLSNATAEQIDRAVAITKIAAVQNRFSPASDWNPLTRAAGLAALARCEELGIAHFGYSPLRGDRGVKLAEHFPRLSVVAAARGVSLERLVLAGQLGRSPALSLVSGATRPETVVDAAAAMMIPWDADLETAFAADRVS